MKKRLIDFSYVMGVWLIAYSFPIAAYFTPLPFLMNMQGFIA